MDLHKLLEWQQRLIRELYPPTAETAQQKRLRIALHLLYGNGAEDTRKEAARLTNEECEKLLEDFCSGEKRNPT